MFIIRVLIYVSLCHLIVCQLTDICKEESRVNRCDVTTPSPKTRLRVGCSGDYLWVDVLDKASANSSGGHNNNTNYPSLTRLWNLCQKKNISGLDDPIDTNHNLKVTVYNGQFTTFADHYFCHFPTTSITLDRDSLGDTRKLGFSSLENCEIRCLTKLETLSLPYNKFDKVANDSFCGLQGLRHLHLTNGQLKELESDAFVHLKSLRSLGLSHNNITILSPGVFRQQQDTLTTLYLNNNKLNGSSILEIKNLRVLEYLNLAQNHIEIIPEGLFDQMSQLAHLNLEYNSIKTLQGALTGLTNLLRLIMFNNNISAIGDDDLRDLVNLTTIELHNNPINTIEPAALTSCVNLKHIKISNNSLSNVPDFITNSERFLSLDLANNKIAHVKVGTFDKGRYIAVIDLSNNQLTDITKVFANCTVRHLNLGYNRITRINFNDFSPRLYILNIDHNHIHTVIGFDLTVRKRWDLHLVDMPHNQLNELTNLSLPESVKIFDASHNNISAMSYSDAYLNVLRNKWPRTTFHLRYNAFKVIEQRLFAPKGLSRNVYYHLNGNPLECSCENEWLLTSGLVDYGYGLTCQQQFQRLGQQPVVLRDHRDYVFDSNTTCRCGTKQNTCSNVMCPTPCKCYYSGNKSIIHVDCPSKNITTLPLTPTVQLGNAQEIYVYLDNNPISQINLDSLLGLNNTIKLYLNHTDLHEMQDGSFDHLKKMRFLHLDHNSLRHISDNIFKKLSSLTHLYLSHNRLQTIEQNAFPSRLHTLHLDNNQLVDYSVWQLQNLTKLGRLRVHANKWSCECNYIEKLSNWLHNISRKGIVEDLYQISCVHTNGTEHRVPVMNLNISRCHDSTVTGPNISDFKKLFNLWLKRLFN